MPIQSRDRLIVALDVPGATQARRLVEAIGEAATTYKVGKQLFTAEGPQIVREIIASGRKVFLDLKFHDIPNTVAEAVRSAASLGVAMLTVHASGGSKMLKAAAEAAAQSPAKPLVLAVTVLTSLSDSDLREIGVSGTVLDEVLRLGALARQAGCGGLVASAKEARELRRELGEGFAIVTPGVRPTGSAAGDQARVVTPRGAIAAGATHLVVGRPIIEAADPAKAAAQIVAEIKDAAGKPWGEPMGETVKLNASDGHELGAYVARPAGTPIAGLIVIQEAFGVNGHIRSVADGFARDGFLAIAPALFDRVERGVELGYQGKDLEKGIALARQINPDNAVKDVAAALDWLRQQKVSRAGVIGYCFGGTMAWLAATRLDVAAAVGYYGGNIARFANETPRCPMMLHFGTLDKHIPKADVDKVQAAHPDVQIFWYEADHGFNCNDRPSYNPAAAKLARERSLEFLKQNLVD